MAEKWLFFAEISMIASKLTAQTRRILAFCHTKVFSYEGWI
jgi:hypothetical protein